MLCAVTVLVALLLTLYGLLRSKISNDSPENVSR